MANKEKQEPVLYIYSDRSILVNEDGVEYKFDEGKTSDEAKKRLASIKEKLEKGFLDQIIKECQNPEVEIKNISEAQFQAIESLVNSVTSEVGRAIVGLAVLQLTVKSLLPEQSIRLHKGGTDKGFSWKEGIPMRVLDKNYFTPILRKHKLLMLNADGIMMTRTLAENYPYSKLYKAAMRGGKSDWLNIVDWLETGELSPMDGLKQILVFLHNKSEAFQKLSDITLKELHSFLKKNPPFDKCYSIIKYFIDTSTYSARMFEVAMHATFQVLEEEKCLAGFLKPLSQMRSANKKHGNIGDIEITMTQGNMDILESWDAKYGKAYLRDELEELDDKLKLHPQATIAGFVTDEKPNLKPEIQDRIKELELVHETVIQVVEFEEWVNTQIKKYALNPDEFGKKWLIAIGESICQKRRETAPIDEPTTEWVETFKNSLK